MSLAYGDEKRLAPQAEKMNSKKRKLSLSMISIGEKKKKVVTCSECGDKDEVRGPETEDLRIRVDEGKVKMMSKEAKKEDLEKMGKEKTKEV